MTTEAERLTSVEAKLDGFIEETRSRFNDMNTNMNSRFNDMSTGMNNRMSREPLNNSAQAWMGRVVPFFGDVQASL